MAPKNKFTKEQIIDAAFEIACIEGLQGITIRKVADQLGSSIAPIYVNFTDINELIKEVVKKVSEISKQYLSEINSGNPFHDIGVASVRFAKDYSVLFRDLVMRPNDHLQDYDENMGNDLVEMMKEDADLEGLSSEELKLILLKMRIFQTGLSVMVANGLLPHSVSEEQIIELLDSTASDLIVAARYRRQS
ncbi:TetR/AcrR family transcriptional regulator [Paenibacillus sp. FSL W7-1287]|uniref:TetR/AcrR family transcriptional regulator n=1 Tax=Paenibacillus sp. FSL W7-1287 TaxID=2954538 RepID=UPI0030F82219